MCFPYAHIAKYAFNVSLLLFFDLTSFMVFSSSFEVLMCKDESTLQ